MNRRRFLSLLAAAAPAFALDPERLLWVPGQRTIFLPPARPLGVLTSIEDMTREALRALTTAVKRPQPAPRVLGASGWKTAPPKPIAPVLMPELGTKICAEARHQVFVSADPDRFTYDRTAVPMMEAVARQIREHGCTRVSVLELPPRQPGYLESALATDPISGLAVRGVLAYDNYMEWAVKPVVRFDVLFG